MAKAFLLSIEMCSTGDSWWFNMGVFTTRELAEQAAKKFRDYVSLKLDECPFPLTAAEQYSMESGRGRDGKTWDELYEAHWKWRTGPIKTWIEYNLDSINIEEFECDTIRVEMPELSITQTDNK